MMESTSPGMNRNALDMKPLVLSGSSPADASVWPTNTDTRNVCNAPTSDLVNNQQLLLIAVEYVNESNPEYGVDVSTAYTQQQPYTEFEDHVSPLDPNMSSTARYSPVYPINGTDNPLTPPYHQNSIVILPNGQAENQMMSAPNGFPLNVDNMDLLRQVVTSRLNRQLQCGMEPNLKQESDSVELLITDQNTGISYTLTPNGVANGQSDLNDMLNTLDQTSENNRLRIQDDRLLDQGMVLDPNNLIALDENVLVDNGSLVLKTDLGQVVQQIDLNAIDELNSIDETIADEANRSKDRAGIDDAVEGPECAEIVSVTLKEETNEYITDEISHMDDDVRLRRSKRQFYERNDGDEDDLDLFNGCPDCVTGGVAELMCVRHRVQQTISDKPVPSRARATLPVSYLCFNKVGNNELGEPAYGVFARKFIPRRTQFGPIEGVLMKSPENNKGTPYEIDLLLESDTGAMHRLNVSDENLSNWMRFVRKASTYRQQNLILSQMGPSLYYITTCNILPRQELMVGYSASYAQKRGLTVLPPEPNDNSIWPCFECNMSFTSYDELHKHLAVHDKIKNEEKKPKYKKTRPKKRTVPSKRKEPWEQSYDSTETGENVVSSSVQSIDQCDADPLSVEKAESAQWKPDEQSENKSPIIETVVCKGCNMNFEMAALIAYQAAATARDATSDQSITSTENPTVKCPQCNKDIDVDRRTTTATNNNNNTSNNNINAENPLVAENKVHAKPYKCNMCYKSFTSSERLERHSMVHGSEEAKPLQCTVCNRRFLNNSALTCHVKMHKVDKQTFECPICKQTFDQMLLHKEHVKTHSQNGTYTCPHCKKVFKEYCIVRKHIRAFHCDRKHSCVYCEKPFPTLDKLRLHLLKHSDHREFLCSFCGKQFKRKDKLKEHTKRMHSRTDPRPSATASVMSIPGDAVQPIARKFTPKVSPTDYHRFIYKCHTCMYGFKRRGMLVNHLAKRHPDIRLDSVPELNLPILRTTRDYYCQYCDKVYKSSSKRKAHIIKNHPGADLPISNRCKDLSDVNGGINLTYSQPVGSVTTNPHNCHWCHKQYASKAKLLQHQRKKHAEMLVQQQAEDRIRVPDTDPLLCEDKPNEQLVDPLPSVDEDGNAVVRAASDGISSEYLSSDQFEHEDMLLNSKENIKICDDQMQTEFMNDAPNEYDRSSPRATGHYYRIIPGPVDPKLHAGNNNDPPPPPSSSSSVLHSLLSSTNAAPVSRVWPEPVTFTPYTPR